MRAQSRRAAIVDASRTEKLVRRSGCQAEKQARPEKGLIVCDTSGDNYRAFCLPLAVVDLASLRLVCLRLEVNQLNRKNGGLAASGKYEHESRRDY